MTQKFQSTKLGVNQEILRKGGGIETAINAMNTHIINDCACVLACFMIIGLLIDISKHTDEIITRCTHKQLGDNLKTILKVGGLETIINTMNVHVNDKKTCEYGSIIIHYMIENNCK